MLIAAILHDTIEDTETTAQELVRELGQEIAHIVLEVTDDRTLSKGERKQLQIDHTGTISGRNWSNWPTRSAIFETLPRRPL